MRTRYTLISSAVVLALLSGCSSGEDIRQAESNFDYLDASQSSALKQNADEKIPTSDAYALPVRQVKGKLGSQVDIRPPVQVLELIPGARAQYRNKEVFVWVTSEKKLTDIWQSIQTCIKDDKLSLRENSNKVIESDWLDLKQEVDGHQILVRYRVEKLNTTAQKGFKISLVGLKNGSGSDFKPTSTLDRRYTISVANQVMTYYDVAQRREAQRKAQEIMRSIPMQMGVDTSALPIVIARIPFDVFWERIPSLLPYLGMEIEDRTRSQGVIEVTHFSPDSDEWEKLSTKPWSLDRHEYQLHLGDLKNRTSISLANRDGKPVPEEELQSFMTGLKAAVAYDNAHPKPKKD